MRTDLLRRHNDEQVFKLSEKDILEATNSCTFDGKSLKQTLKESELAYMMNVEHSHLIRISQADK